MSRKVKTNAEEAASCRRWVRGLRVYGMIVIALGIGFAILGVITLSQGAVEPGISILVSAAIVTFWGVFARTFQANGWKENAEAYERLASWDRTHIF